MTRLVLCEDAVAWLRRHPDSGTVVTSPPDAGELGVSLDAWRPWFLDALDACFAAAGSRPAVFYLSDRKASGRVFSKAAMALSQAEAAGLDLLWHKVVLRRGVGKVNLHRPGFDHLLAFGGPSCRPGKATPDVMERGPALWLHGFGLHAARVAVELAAQHGDTVIAPFCGKGTILAVADERGLRSVGIDNSEELCREAERAGVPTARR